MSGNPSGKKPEYLTARQLADILQVSESTIHRLRRAGRIPSIALTDRIIRFSLRDVKHALKPPDSETEAGQSQTADEPTNQLSFEELFEGFREP